MEFGLAYPGRLDAWKDLIRAEDSGFTHAWFYDSQMLYSDVYACMALAAEHTNTIKLGTGVAIPSNRIAPVTAHSIATINELAPGRAILGVGTGFTGRNTMGLPPVTLAKVRQYIDDCRALLRGEEILFRENQHERWIRFLHPDKGFINLQDKIPLYFAANGPKAMGMAGEIADGWITVFSDAEHFAKDLEHLAGGAAKAGRSVDDISRMALTTACVLGPNESATSSRVIERVGPFAILPLHAMWEQSSVAIESVSDNATGGSPMRDLYASYKDDYIDKMRTREDRRYLEIHEGHLIYLKPGEERYLTEDLVRSSTLTGTSEDIIARIKALERAGLSQVTVQVVTDGLELIEEFGKNVIAKY